MSVKPSGVECLETSAWKYTAPSGKDNEYVEPYGVEYVELSALEYLAPSGWGSVTESLLVECAEPPNCMDPFNLKLRSRS